MEGGGKKRREGKRRKKEKKEEEEEEERERKKSAIPNNGGFEWGRRGVAFFRGELIDCRSLVRSLNSALLYPLSLLLPHPLF